MSIRIYYDNARYRLKNSKEIIKIIKRVIREEKKIPGDLSYIITTDKELKKINRQFLGRDYYTDVIAFDYGEKEIVNGEIYISKETVKRNANNYKVSLRNELLRVIFHGTLHLCGFKDKSKGQKERMRRQEERWLQEIYRKG
ncbi:MAG: rRNA maturation RNase YbeY [Bacteroidota bacterium]